MSLSVCLITSDPAGRIAAVLEPVRDLADEVVIAADARVDAETLAGYAALADTLLRVEFRLYERHLAWLHAQCACDWILRLDGDEIVSGALARRLPELLRSRAARQYFIRRAWLHRDTGRVLAQEPWASDSMNRLVRNDGSLRFAGVQHAHADPAEPAEWIDEPVYHLELLAASEEQRRDKAIRYEVARPHLRAPGGGRINEAFYLPELRGSLRTEPVPAEDRERLERALHPPADVPRADPGPLPVVPLAEMDRHWEPRQVPESAHRAAVVAVRPPPSLAPGELRRVFARVTNQGTERWPWRLEHRPAIRMSYRWRADGGDVVVPDGLRTAFPRTVEPGETILVPVDVAAPAEAGRYVLELDVVHEHVRWFGAGCRVPVAVEAAHELPPIGPRLRETGPPRRSRLSRRPRAEIPHVIHRVWVGEAPMPEAHVEFGRSFERHHPGWEMRLWTDADVDALGIDAGTAAASRTPSELSNLMRYEILHRVGGVYVDTDVVCQKPFDDLIDGVAAFAAIEAPGRVGTAVLGSVPGHPLFARAARLARSMVGLGRHSTDANGPYLLSLLLEQQSDATIFGPERFYPYSWDELERATEPFPDAHAVHHWTLSWLGETGS